MRNINSSLWDYHSKPLLMVDGLLQNVQCLHKATSTCLHKSHRLSDLQNNNSLSI